ncbi:SIMPL domain-containing protein [Chloroflexota bacterium]
MSKKLLLAIGLAVITVAVGIVGCSDGLDFNQATLANGETTILSQQNTGIWVTGEGEVSVVPDVAIVSLGVEVQASTVTAAQQQAAEAMDAVMAVLAAEGIADEDIKTQYYNVYPLRHWDDDQEILIGYRVTNMAAVKIRDVANAGAVIDAVVAGGGDYIRISGISFTVDEPAAYYDEARTLAMNDAKEKAEQLARQAGVSLGKPIFISEGTISSISPYYDAYRQEAAVSSGDYTTSISPGETDVRLTVQVVYSIV